jgi:hypothetical protein
MMWILKLFSLSLRLYPRQFRDRFGSEIEEIFRDGLIEARQEGVMVGYILHELVKLPQSLVGVYMWSMRGEQERQVAVSAVGGGGTIGMNSRDEGWGASFMAGLPHLLIGIVIIGFDMILGIQGENQDLFRYFLITVFALLFLGVLIFNISKGWKNWAASWIAYMFLIGIILLGVLANALPQSVIKNDQWIYKVQATLIPLVLAYFLYKFACKDRLRGLLAAIPAMVIMWIYFLEFVPVLQKSLAWVWIILLAFIATVLMLRAKQFSTALLLAMAVPIFGGIPFTYLGVYMGGTLPFSEPGPSLLEVFKQYLPFMALALSIVLGPQLGVKLRIAGYQSAAAGGKIFYRLVLAGVLLGLFTTLLQSARVLNDFSVRLIIIEALFVSAIVLFLVGFGLLVWAAYKSKLSSSDNGSFLELAALFFPLLFLPVVILVAIPIAPINSSISWLLSAAEVVWVIASTWVVKE